MVILTSTVVAPRPVTIPLRYPVNSEVSPTPAISWLVSETVTPCPTTIPAVVPIPSVWSAALSITQTLRLFAQVPGVLAA